MIESQGLCWTATIDGVLAITVKVTLREEGWPIGVDLEAHAPLGKKSPAGSPWQYWGHTTFVDVGRSLTVSLQAAKTKEEALRVLTAICSSLSDSRFAPAGPTDDPLVPVCRSAMDLAARGLLKRLVEGKRAQ